MHIKSIASLLDCVKNLKILFIKSIFSQAPSVWIGNISAQLFSDLCKESVRLKALAQPLKDIYRVIPKSFLCCGLTTFLHALSCWEINLCPLVRDPACSGAIQHTAAFIFSWTLTSFLVSAAEETSPQHDVTATMLHCYYGIHLMMSDAWFSLDFNTCFI